MSEDKIYSRRMTPVRVIEEGDGFKVIFLESARFYHLSRENAEFDSLLASLRRAIEEGGDVEVSTESIESDVIKDIKRVN